MVICPTFVVSCVVYFAKNKMGLLKMSVFGIQGSVFSSVFRVLKKKKAFPGLGLPTYPVSLQLIFGFDFRAGCLCACKKGLTGKGRP